MKKHKSKKENRIITEQKAINIGLTIIFIFSVIIWIAIYMISYINNPFDKVDKTEAYIKQEKLIQNFDQIFEMEDIEVKIVKGKYLVNFKTETYRLEMQFDKNKEYIKSEIEDIRLYNQNFFIKLVALFVLSISTWVLLCFSIGFIEIWTKKKICYSALKRILKYTKVKFT